MIWLWRNLVIVEDCREFGELCKNKAREEFEVLYQIIKDQEEI